MSSFDSEQILRSTSRLLQVRGQEPLAEEEYPLAMAQLNRVEKIVQACRGDKLNFLASLSQICGTPAATIETMAAKFSISDEKVAEMRMEFANATRMALIQVAVIDAMAVSMEDES